MRTSELMELQVGCRRPVEEPTPGLMRYRLASKLVKGQPLGGTETNGSSSSPPTGPPRSPNSSTTTRARAHRCSAASTSTSATAWFRNWVNCPAGHACGLAADPRRTGQHADAAPDARARNGLPPRRIARSEDSAPQAHRAATTEGYASRPGGAQAELLAEVNKHEPTATSTCSPNSATTSKASCPPDPAPGILSTSSPTSTAPGTRAPADGPKVQHNDRDVLNLLSKRAKALHLGPANYCWFTDPSRALCLKLAGTPHARPAPDRDV